MDVSKKSGVSGTDLASSPQIGCLQEGPFSRTIDALPLGRCVLGSADVTEPRTTKTQDGAQQGPCRAEP